MRVFRKILLWILGIAGIIMVAAVILGKLFEDELTRYAVNGLNRYLRTEVRVEKTELSFLKKFPDASLEFSDVFIASVPDFRTSAFGERNTDTLLSAGQLFLKFNVFKLLRRQYLVKEVQVQSGKLNIFIDPEGNGNYRIWKEKETEGSKDFRIELNNVKLTDVLVDFDNKALELDILAAIHKSSFRGEFSKESYSMSAGLNGILHHYSNKGTVFMRERKISSGASMFIDPQAIRISRGEFVLGSQHLMVSGKILRPSPLDLELNIEGKQLDLENILKHVVQLSKKYPEDLRAGGNLDFRGSIRGTLSNTRMPLVEAGFSLQNGWVQSSQLPREISEIRMTGDYTNGLRQDPRTTRIRLNDLSMRFGNSRLGGDYSILNLIRPEFEYSIKADLDLSDIRSLILNDTLFDILQGRLLAEVRIQGNHARKIEFSKSDFLGFNYMANIHLEEVSMKLNKQAFGFEEFSGDAVFTDHLDIKTLSGSFEGSQISISGRVDNFLEFMLTPDGNLWMDADLYSERLDLNHLRSMNTKSGNTTGPDTVFLPERLYLKTQFWFDELEIRDFAAEQVTGNFIYKPRRLSINHIELLSMDGRVVSEGFLEQQHGLNFLVKSSSRIYSVDIGKAFSSFNNFGQDFISDRHLSGSLSGTVDFSAGLDETMKINKETILTDCDININNGELSGFEPMMKLSRFIEVEELENIRFSTLTNEIFIRNEEVVIPSMDIQSSAFNITASGIHGFDKEFTYKLRISLTELLAKKSKKPPEEDSEFGVIKDDGLGNVNVFLIIEGSPEGTDVRYDRRGAVQNIREQLRAEKQELKQIFNEEFGIFSKDSTLAGDNGEQDAPDFIIEWEEEGDSIGPEDLKVNNKTAKERFIIVWDEEEEEKVQADTLKRKKRRRKK